MPLRFDAKTVLGMFQQSRMQAEEEDSKNRMADLNKQIEERKIKAEEDWNQKRYDVQKGEADAQAALRTQQYKELQRPHEVRGKAKDLFTPDMFKYNNVHPEADVTNEQFDAAIAHTEKMTAFDVQRQIALASDASRQIKEQMNAKLMLDDRERAANKEKQSWLASLPGVGSYGEGLPSNPLWHTLGAQNTYTQSVLNHVQQIAARQQAITAGATNPKLTAYGIDPFAETGMQTLDDMSYLNTVMDKNGQISDTFDRGSGRHDIFTDDAQKNLYNQVLQAVPGIWQNISRNNPAELARLRQAAGSKTIQP